MAEQERIQLRSKWEQLALKIASGMSAAGAYSVMFPNNSSPGSSASRLLSNHPEINERVQQLRDRIEDKVVNTAAMTSMEVQDALLENIEHAKSHGRAIVNKLGEVVAWQRNHGAVNQALKIISDINGLSIKANAEKERGADDPEVQLTPDQLLASVLRRYAESRGMKIDQLTRHALTRIANAAGARLPAGDDSATEAEVLRSVSETDSIPQSG